MRVTIRLFASLRERAGLDHLVLEDVPDGTTVAGLKGLAVEACPALGDLGSVAGVVGTTYVAPETVVEAGDDVAFLPPVSGGAPRGGDVAFGDSLDGGVFELRADSLDLTEIQARVSDPSCGAIVLFTGLTRDTNRGRGVVELDYEAFAEMTGPEMGRIFEDCVREHGPGSPSALALGLDDQGARLRMLAVHRVGVCPVGEPSVAIAVASPHRDGAFRAARFLIDTLKERLPVWKKEVYGDGHHWIGDRS